MNPRKSLSYPFFLVTFISILLLITPFSEVQATGYQKYDLSDARNLDFMQNQHLHHSSGKLVYVYFNETGTTEQLEIMVWKSDGSFDGDYQIPRLYTTIHGKTRIKVVELDDDEILIMWTESYASQQASIRTCRLDLDTYASIIKWFGMGTSGTYTWTGIDYVSYEDDIYFFITQVHISQTGQHNLMVFKYDTGIDTFTQEIDQALDGLTSTDAQGFLKTSQYEGSKVLVCFSTTATETRPEYWLYDLDLKTFEYQADSSYSMIYQSNEQFCWISEGYRLSGDYIYAYFTWTESKIVSGSPQLRFVQQRLVYNQTIEQSELLYQNTRMSPFYPACYEAPLNEYWVLGYQEDDNASLFNIYNEIQQVGENEELLWETRFEIIDWFNYEIITASVIYSRESDEEIYSDPTHTVNNGVYDTLWRDWTSQFQTVGKYNTKYFTVFWDLIPQDAEYDIIFSWTPDETPKYVDKTYRFSFTALRNDAGFTVNYVVYMDSVQRLSGQTLSNGVMRYGSANEVGLLFGTEGIHIMTVDLLELGTAELLYTESYSDVWSTTIEDPEEVKPVIIPIIGMISTFLPIFFVLLVPSMALAREGGIVGLIAGLSIGLVIGAISGLIPTYAVFLGILAISMGFVYYVRRS